MSANALMRIIANENDEIELVEEMTNALLACLIESKVEHEYNGKDFTSDLVILYGNI